MNSNLQDLIQKIKPYLRQYLIDNNVEIVTRGNTEFFKCINPNHIDNDPSNGFIKGTEDQQFHCFSCLQASGDIFTAAHLLEGKPLYGANFVKDNLEYLLKKYSIDYTIEWTEEQLEAIKIESIYEEASRLMNTVGQAGQMLFVDHAPALARGWTTEICRKIGVGTIKDFDTFIDALSKSTKISKEELIRYGIKQTMFGPDYITICIRDHKAVMRGFVARYLHWKKGSEIPKYCNTSIADNPNYQKEKLLFCLDIAKKYKTLRLDIFEGYGSAIVAHQNSYYNSVALGSTAFTDEHMTIIKELGFEHINLVLDQDTTGNDMMDKYIEKFGGQQGLIVTITNLPLTEKDKQVPGQNDPDYYIRTYGINEYRKLKPEGVFEHMLKKHKQSLDPENNAVFTRNFAKQVIPLIVNQPDMIERSAMISTLSKMTGIDKEDIRQQIVSIEKTDIRSIKDEIFKRLRNVNDSDGLKDLLSRSINTIEDSGTSKDEKYLRSVTESVEIFDGIFTEMNSLPEGIHGWKTGFTAFDSMLDGIPKPTKGGTAIGFASAPQHGKSAIMLNLAVKLASNNQDIAVCYWAIDDHRKAIAYRLVSILSGVHMKKVKNTVKRTEEDEKAIREAQELLRELISSRRLVFKDDRYGRSKSKAETWLKETQDATGRHILFCVDSLHNVQGESGSETRVKIMNTSTWLKSLCASLPATIMTSIELVKNKVIGVKPTLQSISESGKVEFDFDTLAIVWNEAQGNYRPVEEVQAKWGLPGNYKPIIEIDFQKNKAGAGEKGSLFLKYDTDTTAFVDCLSYSDYMMLNKGPSTIKGGAGQSYSFGRKDPPEDTHTEW